MIIQGEKFYPRLFCSAGFFPGRFPMDDGLGLGLVKPQKEHPSGASELFIGKIGSGLFSAGPPDMAHHAGKLTKHLLQVNKILNVFIRLKLSRSPGSRSGIYDLSLNKNEHFSKVSMKMIQRRVPPCGETS